MADMDYQYAVSLALQELLDAKLSFSDEMSAGCDFLKVIFD
jgi:hypothetical protein